MVSIPRKVTIPRMLINHRMVNKLRVIIPMAVTISRVQGSHHSCNVIILDGQDPRTVTILMSVITPQFFWYPCASNTTTVVLVYIKQTSLNHNSILHLKNQV